VAIHQPNFFPRLKILQKLATADLWIVLDSVQYCAREWQNRTRIVTAYDSSVGFWFTIPVHRPRGQSTIIKNTIAVPPVGFGGRLEKILRHAYRKSPYWNEIESLSHKFLDCNWNGSLTDICINTTLPFLCSDNKKPELLYSSKLKCEGRSSKLIAAICKEVGATEYLADSGAATYLDINDFEGITVSWQQWQEPDVAPQSSEKWRNISPLNYLAQVGWDSFSYHISRSAIFNNTYR
jgi:hypothetical protein